MKSVFTYLDYRQFLLDYYSEKKKTEKFSYREFASRAGFSSPVFIKLVIEGKSNLRKSSIPKITQALGLIKKERMYFKYLVLFNQSKDVESKMIHLRELQKITSLVSVQALSDDKFEYFSEWYHSIVRELISVQKLKIPYKDLGQLVLPPISAEEAESSVKLLVKLGMIIEKPNGSLSVTDQFVSSRGMEMQTLAIKNFQRKMTLLAAEAIETIPKEERDISGVTIGISTQSLEKIQQELERCRTRVMEIASEDKESDRVYRVNLHLFPVSSKVHKRNSIEKGKIVGNQNG